MKKTDILILIIVLSIAYTKLYSQTEFYPAKTIDVNLFYGEVNGSSYFDLEGDLKTDLPDYTLSEDQKRNYRFLFKQNNFGVHAEYALTDKIVLFTEIPLSYSTIQENVDTTYYLNDTLLHTKKINIADESLFQPAYYSIGGRYLFYSKLAYAALNCELRIPSGLYDGIQNDPDYKFLSDGAFEIYGGIILGAKFAKGWMESNIQYRLRQEELDDQLYIHTEGGLTTVPGSKFGISAEFIQSIGAFQNAILFDPLKTTLQENTFNMSVFFQMFFSENVYIDLSYKLNLLGKNTMNYAGPKAGFGVRL